MWKEGLDEHKNGNIAKAISLLEDARELDFITPRIKKGYAYALKEVAAQHNVPYVKINISRNKNDGRDGESYFCDYCHPIEKANKLIANEIIKTIKALETGKKW